MPRLFSLAGVCVPAYAYTQKRENIRRFCITFGYCQTSLQQFVKELDILLLNCLVDKSCALVKCLWLLRPSPAIVGHILINSLDVLSVWVETGLQKFLKKLNLILQKSSLDKSGATDNCLWLFSAYLQQNF